MLYRRVHLQSVEISDQIFSNIPPFRPLLGNRVNEEVTILVLRYFAVDKSASIGK